MSYRFPMVVRLTVFETGRLFVGTNAMRSPQNRSPSRSTSQRTHRAMTSSSSKAIMSPLETGLAVLLRVVNRRRVRSRPGSSSLWATKMTGTLS